DNNINNIMLIDCSARPLYIAIRKLWKNKFPKLKQPQIYFTNPEAYQTSMSFETQDHNNHYLKKFENTYKKLAKKKEEKLLLFDMCAHTGDTLRPIINLLKYNEYNVVVGIAQKNPLFEEIVFDFIALNRECRLKCSPFGIEHMVSKNGFKMLSSPNQNKGNAIQLRKQISKIIDEFS
ncbi:hypothetical protein HOK68_03380, partial [Candidatus Woesearchaeota archaeon]|nr:hypothetical protein [Candidatus Woesearchaeota archaeon]